MKLEYTITPNLYREYAYKVRYKNLLILGSILSLIEFILGIYNRDFLTIVLSIINILIFFSLPLINVKLYFLINKTYLENYTKFRLYFKDNIIIEEGNNHLEYSYSLIKSIKETPNLLVLILPYNQALLISKVGVNIKKINSLINFLNIKINIKL